MTMKTISSAKNTSSENKKNMQKSTNRVPKTNKIHPAQLIQRTHMNPASLTREDVMQLQSIIGNRGVIQLLSKSKGIEESEESVQMKKVNEEKNQLSKSNKTGMPDNLKSGLETLSNIDLSDVRVHHNSDKPTKVGALAYTQGSNIYISQGAEKYLPHEGWHVVQQKQGRVKPTLQMKGGININDDKSLEKEADTIGAAALKTHPDRDTKTGRFNSKGNTTNFIIQKTDDNIQKKQPKSSGKTSFQKKYEYYVLDGVNLALNEVMSNPKLVNSLLSNSPKAKEDLSKAMKSAGKKYAEKKLIPNKLKKLKKDAIETLDKIPDWGYYIGGAICAGGIYTGLLYYTDTTYEVLSFDPKPSFKINNFSFTPTASKSEDAKDATLGLDLTYALRTNNFKFAPKVGIDYYNFGYDKEQYMTGKTSISASFKDNNLHITFDASVKNIPIIKNPNAKNYPKPEYSASVYLLYRF